MLRDVVEEIHTSLRLTVSGWFVIYSVKLPPGIQSEMSRGGSITIPRSGTTFGCQKPFHTTAAW